VEAAHVLARLGRDLAERQAFVQLAHGSKERRLVGEMGNPAAEQGSFGQR
jgi:hypothetical protein